MKKLTTTLAFSNNVNPFPPCAIIYSQMISMLQNNDGFNSSMRVQYTKQIWNVMSNSLDINAKHKT